MIGTIVGSKRALASASLLFFLVAGFGFSTSTAYAAKGDKEFKAGQKYEARKDYDAAVREYDKAVKLDPTNPQYLLAQARARFRAGVTHVSKGEELKAQGKLKEALAEFEQAIAIDPSNDAARQEISRTRKLMQEKKGSPPAEQKQPPAQEAPPASSSSAEPAGVGGTPPLKDALGPPRLHPLSRAPINLRMTNNSKIVFETIGKLAGINVLFDPDFIPKRVSVELNNVSLEEALDQTAILTKTFWKVLTRNAILVVPDTAVKRREQQEQIIKTFYLSNPDTPQELTAVVTAIRSLLETRRIQQINSLNAIIIRDTPARVAVAEKIIRDVDKAKPEVVVDVAVLEARRDKTQQLGLYPVSGSTPGIQSSATFTPGGLPSSSSSSSTTTTTPSGSIGLNQLGHLSTGDWSITLPGASLNAIMSDAHTKVLQRPEIRALNGEKATLRIGDRVPVATGSFQPGIGGVGINPLVNTQFQYIDVGVNLDITPEIHLDHQVTLKVRVEVSQVTGTSNIGGIDQPIIGQRIIDHEIRLREGEINVLGGLMQTQVIKTISGVPGLSQIPLLKYLFSNASNTLSQDEVLIVLVPHIVRLPDILPFDRRGLDVGTEGDFRLRSSYSEPEVTPTPTAQATPAGAPSARMRLENSHLEHKTGEVFEVPVQIENAKDASAASFVVSYNKDLMKLVKIRGGGFLGRDGQPVAVVQSTDQQSGKTTVTLTRPPASPGITGDGTLAVLTFQANRSGSSPLSITPGEVDLASEAAPIAKGDQATVTIR